MASKVVTNYQWINYYILQRFLILLYSVIIKVALLPKYWCGKLIIHHTQTMDSHGDETVHIVSWAKFENNKSYKEKILQEIIAAICALLNSNGGKVVIHFDTDDNIPTQDSPSSQMALVIRILEQYMMSVIGIHSLISKINFTADKKSIVIIVKKADFLITINYKLFFPSQTQVVQLSSMESAEMVRDNIINRKIILEPVQLCLQREIFRRHNTCSFVESKIVAFKYLKANPSKRTTFADRMTCKGNKFSCYVSAFANYRGGHIYYGITDEGIVEGEFIPNEKSKKEIIMKVKKTINKMIWPEQIGEPTRGVHWEIYFEPVVDKNFKPVPSTFVIVIYIASCLGGVFTEVPECYEMVDQKVLKMSFATWKKRISQPVWLCGKDEILPVVSRTTWSSNVVRRAFTVGYEKLRQPINNGDWDAFSKVCESLQKRSHLHEVSLVILSKKITACYAKGCFREAAVLLQRYKALLPNVQDILIFEVIYFNLKAALKRAQGDFKALAGLLTEALSKAQMIEPGLVTATVYIFAATVTDLINVENELSPHVLSIKALEHLQCTGDSDFPSVLADKKQRVHTILATFYLRCNISGQLINRHIDTSDIDKAKSSIMAVHQSALDGHQLSKYREIQFNLVLSIYNYRRSQVTPDIRVSLLRNAFNYAKKAECFARDCKFLEMVEWSKANEALCTEELVRAKFGLLK